MAGVLWPALELALSATLALGWTRFAWLTRRLDGDPTLGARWSLALLAVPVLVVVLGVLPALLGDGGLAGPTCIERGWFEEDRTRTCVDRAEPLLLAASPLALAGHHALLRLLVGVRAREGWRFGRWCGLAGGLLAGGLLAGIGTALVIEEPFFGEPALVPWTGALVGGGLSGPGWWGVGLGVISGLGTWAIGRLRRRSRG